MKSRIKTFEKYDAKTTMLLMLRAFQAADDHILYDTEQRQHYEKVLASVGIDDMETLMHNYIELMNTFK